jgi:hypothetical protein
LPQSAETVHGSWVHQYLPVSGQLLTYELSVYWFDDVLPELIQTHQLQTKVDLIWLCTH